MKVWLLVLVGWCGATLALAQNPPAAPTPLDLRPTAAPVPALKYRFVPGLSEQTPGNAVQLYYRAFSPEWTAYRRDKEFENKMERWSKLTLAELKLTPEVRFVEGMQSLKEVDRAARRTNCDWEMGPRLLEDGINTLLPDAQAMREYARLLTVRARVEIADGKYAQACETLKTGITLGRHVSLGGTLIHGLVGIAICTQMLTVVEEFIQQPGAPNLYWALADLPQPLIDIRPGLEGEREIVASLPLMRELRKGPLSTDYVNQLRKKYASAVPGIGNTEGADIFLAWSLMGYTRAKTGLIASGNTAEAVNAMPVAQVVLLHEMELYERQRDNLFKWFNFPYPVAAPRLAELDQQLKTESKDVQGVLARLLLPAVGKVLFAQVRTQRRVAALQTIEALRLHAAQTGKWPDKLSDVTVAPIPDDPVLGKPFEYRRDGNSAYLTAAAPPREVGPNATLSYWLKLAAK